MKTSIVRILLFAIVGFAFTSSASALPPWKPKFQEMFVDDGPQSLKDAFANKVIGSCKVCHVNGEEKTVRNPFGQALDKLIEGKAGKRLKAAAEKGDEAKAAMQSQLDKEYLAALEKVLKQSSPSGGGTYGDRIKAGQLPFVPADTGLPNTLTEQEKTDGWQLLFDGKTASGWNSWRTKKPLELDKWVVEDEALTLNKGGGDIYTGEAFENFELVMEWKTSGNSGIMIRVNPEAGGAIYSVAPEMQVNRGMGNSKTSTAALYSIYAVEGEPVYHADGWNEVRIRMVNGEGTHWFNGQQVYSYKIGSDDWNERIANSKWKNKKGFGETAKGHIGLQDHGAKVSFRNIKIRILESN
jgi:cytochrome c553